MRLILVRHGRTSSNVGFHLDTAAPGADLDQTGREQAEALVDRLADYPISAIFTSNLVRTQQTAEPLARKLELAPVVLPGLREVSAGDQEMSTDSSDYIATLLSWLGGDLSAQLPGGERAVDFFDRFDQAVQEIYDTGVETAMLVSHGAALRTWGTYRVPEFAEQMGHGNFDNTGFFVLDGKPGAWELVRIDGIRFHGALAAAQEASA